MSLDDGDEPLGLRCTLDHSSPLSMPDDVPAGAAQVEVESHEPWEGLEAADEPLQLVLPPGEELNLDGRRVFHRYLREGGLVVPQEAAHVSHLGEGQIRPVAEAEGTEDTI